jgi:hypothetical protein
MKQTSDKIKRLHIVRATQNTGIATLHAIGISGLNPITVD